MEKFNYKEMLQACRSSFMYVGVFSFLVNLLMLTLPIYMLQIFDRVLASQNYNTLIYLTFIAVFALLAMTLLDIARSRMLIFVGKWLDNRLSPAALWQSGDTLLAGISYGPQSLRDVSLMRNFLTGSSIFAIFDAPWTPVYILVIFLLKPVLGIIALIGAIVLFSLAVLNEITTRGPLLNANLLYQNNQHQIDTSLEKTETLQAMGMLPAVIKRWFEKNEKILHWQNLASKKSGLILSVAKFLRLVVQIAILAAGAFFVVKNLLTPGAMIAASIITARALAPIEQSISAWKQFISSRQAYYRLRDYLNLPNPRGETATMTAAKGALSVENITFAVKGRTEPILQQINFTLKPGEQLAIIGPSGAGKSTLARLIVGLWAPQYGKIRLDEQDVYQWERSDFGKHVGYLPQSVDLFSGSIHDNIARLQTDANEVDVIAAAKFVDAHDLILHVPNAYEAKVSDYSLSAGQKQRIGLARAFFGKPKLVVLDEPNASLDHEGEEALRSALAKARAAKITIVMVSHRPSVVTAVDKIMILKAGRMEGFGDGQEILHKLNLIAETEHG